MAAAGPAPRGTLTVAPAQGAPTQALAVDRSALTVWQLMPGGQTWARAQTMNVPIQYGSSG